MVRINELRARLPKPGTPIDQRYRLHTALGHGGFSAVWHAHDEHTDTECALKFLTHRNLELNLARFQAEFQLLTRIQHPHINPVTDYGHDAQHGYYFAAPLLTGTNIAEHCASAPVSNIETLYAQVLRALAYLHSHGIYHGDIKPANILVQHESAAAHAMLIDFGFAAVQAHHETLGTPSYMAPELFLDSAADGRADLYALGVVLYRCLTGENPFAALTLDDAKVLHLQHHPAAPTQRKPELPAYFDIIVSRLLAKHPNDRYATANDALRDLQLLSPHTHQVETQETINAYLPPSTLMLGRQELWQQAVQWLDAPRDILCAHGDTGMGKTAFLTALKHAAQLRELPCLAVSANDNDSQSPVRQRLAEVLAGTHTQPQLLLIDDYDALQHDALLEELIRRIAQGDLPQLACGITCTRQLPQLSGTMTLTLKPFQTADTAAYLDTIAPLSTAQRDSFARTLTQHSLGNPALLQHIVQNMLHDGILIDAKGQWNAQLCEDISIDPQQHDIPAQLLHTVRKTLAAIPEKAQALVQCLSCVYSAVTLDDILSIFAHDATHDALQILLRAQLVSRKPQSAEFLLISPLLRQSMLQSMSIAEQQHWHDRLAELYEEQGVILAQYHRAHGSDTRAAGAALLQYCEHSFRQGQLQHTIALLEDRLAASSNTQDTYALRFLLSKVYFQANCLDAGQHTLEALAQESKHAGDQKQHVHAIELLARTLLRAEQIAAAEKLLDDILPEYSDASALRARLLNARARCFMQQSNYDEAIALAEQAATLAKTLPHAEQVSIDNSILGQCYVATGRYAQALTELHAQLEVLQQHAAPQVLASVHLNLANAYLRQDDYAAAQEHFDHGAAYAKQAQDLRLLAAAYSGLGSLAAQQDNAETAIDYLERALPLSYRAEDWVTTVTIGLNLGHLHTRLQHDTLASSLLHAALASTKNPKIPTRSGDRLQCAIYHLLGELARRAGQFAAAKDYLDQAWQRTEQYQDMRDRCFAIQITRAELARDQGNIAEAHRWLTAAQDYPHSKLEEQAFAEVKRSLG